jgi:hypothetical protein
MLSGGMLSDGLLSSSDSKLKTQIKQQKPPSDDLTIQFLHASDEWKRRSSRRQ